MKTRLFFALLFCFILSACVSDDNSHEYDYNKETLKGKWQQDGVKTSESLYLEFGESTMKLYHYDEDNEIVYLVNGSYVINDNNTITAKDLQSNSYKNYSFQIPYCDVIFFNGSVIGFSRIK